MTAKDYRLIAEAISRVWEREEHMDLTTLDAVVSALADALKGDNERFDRERFIAACVRRNDDREV